MSSSSREGFVRGFMASPHPTEGKCLHEGCGGPLTDIWAEFLENPAEKAAVSLGQADFTCPYCNRPLRFDPATNRVVQPQVESHSVIITGRQSRERPTKAPASSV